MSEYAVSDEEMYDDGMSDGSVVAQPAPKSKATAKSTKSVPLY